MKVGKIGLIVIIQIFLLVSISFSHSYIIAGMNLEVGQSRIRENDFIKEGINLLVGFLTIKEIGLVSAQDTAMWCCADTCDDILMIDEIAQGNCENLIETSCDATPACQKGCCYDSIEGTCDTTSPRGMCEENENTEWTSDTKCSRTECRKGCCVLGSDAKFIEEKKCEVQSDSKEVEKDWRHIWSETQCLALASSQIEGACVFEEGVCKFETEVECILGRGEFYPEILCSADELNTICEKQDYVGCVEGKREVYWFDSCGNRENIYSSDKTVSWHNGRVLKKNESCGADSSNGNADSSSCGNCIYPLSQCSEAKTGERSVKDGNYVCKNLGCENAPKMGGGTQARLNGEKWCLYDSTIQGGKMPAGSESWLAYCFEGEIGIEPPNSGERSYLCQEEIIEDGDLVFSSASYTPNDATRCLEEYNPLDEEKKTECESNEHCMINSIDLGEYFSFSMCVPKYPKGAYLTNEIDDNFCARGSTGSNSCHVVYKKTLIGWECEENCDCETEEFSKQMNDLCISIGDCGSYVNYIGEGTPSAKITGKKGYKLDSNGNPTEEESEGVPEEIPDVYSWTNYQNDVETERGEYIEPKNISEYLKIYGGMEEINNWVNGISGIGGLSSLLAPSLSESIKNSVLLGGLTWGNLFTALGATAAGVYAANFLTKTLGISGPEAITMLVFGGLAGAGVGILILTWGASNAWNITGWILLGVGGLVVGVMAIFGVGEREVRIIEFECLPWVAPSGGEDCSKCGDNPLIPCTEYKCQSLGQLCTLINENDEEARACISLEEENNAPVISVGEMKTEGHSFDADDFENQKIGIISETDGGCVRDSIPLAFTLETDEYAQCKYSFEAPSVPQYDQMEGEFPFERNLYTKIHTFSFNMLSVNDERVFDLEKNGEEITGKARMYIKCQDRQEQPNYNPKEYVIDFCVYSGPDETVVNFNNIKSEPKDGATIAYGETEKEVKFWLPEKATCRYDSADKIYETMANELTCGNQKEIKGWPCETTLTGLTSGSNEFYIRCQDVAGNINGDSRVYDLEVSTSELKIDSIKLNSIIQERDVEISDGGSFITNIEPISMNTKVQTSGGGDEGESTCYWGIEDEGERWLMSPYYEYSKLHNQLIPKMSGTHQIYISCEDEAGNSVEDFVEFDVELDSSAPKIVRAYREGDNLKILTDEDARCYYSLERCNFDLETGTSITDLFSKSHVLRWTSGVTYYIKCKDLFNNINIDCARRIIPI